MRFLAHHLRPICPLLAMLFAGLAAKAAEPGKPPAIFNVRQFGAKGTGATLDTAAIQSAIDAASKAGGGIVWLPAGNYLSGSLELKSHVELRLDRGAVLLGSPSRADYKRHSWYALLLADGQEDIKLTGNGVIDGQGLLLAKDTMRRAALGEYGPMSPEQQEKRNRALELPDSEFSQKTLSIRPSESERPMLLEFSDCRNILVSGVTLRNSSGWVQTYARCDRLIIENVKVYSTSYWNNDGIDLTDCRNVRVSKCDVNTADDGICLKSGASGQSGQGDGTSGGSQGCENISISDCRIRSSASALKMGTASFGGFRKIRISNLTIYNTYRAAIALESVDGGTLDDVVIDNVTATNTGCAIFLRLGQRNKKAPVGTLQNVTIRNVKVWVPAGKPDEGYRTVVPYKSSKYVLPSSIVGLPDNPVRNVRLENIDIFYPGGGRSDSNSITADNLDAVPEKVSDYPEFSMFGELPSWGFYVRHVDGIQFTNVHLVRKTADARPAAIFDDVQKMRLSGLVVKPTATTPDVILQRVRQAIFDLNVNSNVSRKMIRLNEGCEDLVGLK